MRRLLPRTFETLIGTAVLLLGAVTVCGWLFHVPAMVQIRPGLVPMVFNTGLCFALVGIALSLQRVAFPQARAVRTCIGLFVLALCGVTLVELLLDRSLGVDLPSVHEWFNYGNTRPGRMAPNTATGFMVIAAAILLVDRVKSRRSALALVTLTFAVLTIGLTGLVGYLLAPDLLFGWARSARMAVHTASGMLLAAAGLWLAWFNSPWYREETYFGEDGKIRVLSAAILLIVTPTAGLTGFALLERSLESTLESRLQAIIDSRGPSFRAMTQQAAKDASASIVLARLEPSGAALLRDRGNASVRAAFKQTADTLLRVGYRALVIEDASGHVIASEGRLNPHPEFDAALGSDKAQELVWDGETVLRTRHRVAIGGEPAGSIVLDKAMPELGRPLFNMSSLGSAAELAACVRREGGLMCLPNERNQRPFFVDRRAERRTALPMELALAGERGIIYTLDYRGQNVIAAYGLLAPGLGFVAKQDTQEAFTPIRLALARAAPIIVLLALLGAALMYWQLNPLVARMRRSEAMASNAAAKMQTIMDAAGDGIITIDHAGVIESANGAAEQVFGYSRGELVGQNVTVLMPQASRAAHQQGLARVVAGGPPRLMGTPNVQVEGLRKDGSTFPLELTLNAVPVQGQRLFVGVMRDITARRELEERLSRMAQYDGLTGLPNRVLFLDRLGTAMTRAVRSQRPFAVMFIDLDGFKAINDAHGHPAGDEVLIQTAHRLSAAVRKSDTVARLAGDEFTIILEDLANSDVDANAVALKVVELMRAPFWIADRSSKVTASVGVVIHDVTTEGTDPSALLKKADEAMYAAKRSGKDRFLRHV